MHPYQHITHAQYHIDDMQATAARHRLARRAQRARRTSGARSPAPARAEPDHLVFLTAPNWRRPAA
jgi:hypothetical protein